ncbi:MAG TPA: hypothetical protein VMM56_08970 [Planctomycetaceae bacterium]|nr:hypothetical protein [Planctomycetaceae bacterium]
MQHRLKRTTARRISLAICLVLSAGLFVLSGSILPDSAAVTIRLIDNETGRPLAGVIQIVLPDRKRRRQPDLVRELFAEIVAIRKTVDEQSKFADEQERPRFLDVLRCRHRKTPNVVELIVIPKPEAYCLIIVVSPHTNS